MIELEMKIQRDAAGLVVGVALRIGEGTSQAVSERVDLVQQIERFLAAAFENGRVIEGRNPAAALFESFTNWSAGEGLPCMTVKRFAAAMRAAGFSQVASNGRKWVLPPGTAERLRPSP